jgi:magnesium transporter
MFFKTYPPPGTPPGTLVRGAEKPAIPSRLSIIWYDGKNLEEIPEATVADCQTFRDRPGVLWIHLQGLGNLELLQELGQYLQLHPLALEDVVEGRAPIKVEDYGVYLFMVTRLLGIDDGVTSEQISLFLGPRFLLGIQESSTDHFAVIRQRLRREQGLIRQYGSDFLAYALLDIVVDSWFPVLETMGEQLEELEDRVTEQPDGKVMEQIQGLRRIFFRLRRLIWPLRETINTLLRQETQLITDHTRLYLRDCYDHAFQVLELLESYRDMTAGIIELYLSSLSMRLNEIMKVLTLFATIFIPITFITGLYGMNFNPKASPWNMPELDWRFGYPFVLGLIAVVATSLFIYFRRKKWI